MHTGITFRIYIPVIALILLSYATFWFYKSSTQVPLPIMVSSNDQAVDIDAYLTEQGKYLHGGKLLAVKFPVAKSFERSHQIIERQGILYIKPNAAATIVVSHGFMCDKFDISFIRKTLFSEFNVLSFDFRAHGSGVEVTHVCTFGKDEALDVIGAVNYIKSRYDIGHLPVIGYGFSMGAVASIQAQAHEPDLFKALILDCPYDRTHNILKRSIEHLKFTFFGYTFALPGRDLLYRFAFNYYIQTLIKKLLKTIAQLDAVTINVRIHPLSPVNSVKKIKIPCFFIHCMHDEKINIQAAHKIYNNLSVYKRLWITNGRRHFDSIFYNPEKYIHKVRAFVNDVLSKKYTQKTPEKIHYDKPIKQE